MIVRAVLRQGLRGGSGAIAPSMSAIRAHGIWTWFIDPRAVHYNTQTYWGYVNALGDIRVESHRGGIKVAGFTLKAALEVDDHDNPSFLVRDSDKKLLAFYSKHDLTDIYQRISSNTEDASAWAAEVNLHAQLGGTAYTYPNPIQLISEANDPIYLFYRDRNGSNSRWAYGKSNDGGATWATRVTLFEQDTSAYLRFASNNTDRIDLAGSTHPANDTADKIWHFYYTGGSWLKSDGSAVGGALPLDGADVTEVYDSSPDKCWIWDIARDGGGNLAIVFIVSFSTTDHRYYYARWNGSAWVVNPIVAGGTYLYAAEAYYAGGVVIDPANVNVVYLSRQINSIYEIWKYTTSDSGSTWVGESLTAGSRYHNFRPACVRNAPADMKLFWVEGRYTTYIDYATNIRSSRG